MKYSLFTKDNWSGSFLVIGIVAALDIVQFFFIYSLKQSAAISAAAESPHIQVFFSFIDFIFTMTDGHRMAMVSHWPEIAARTRVLSPDNRDISDPIGGSGELYKSCSDQIKSALEKRVAEFEFEP